MKKWTKKLLALALTLCLLLGSVTALADDESQEPAEPAQGGEPAAQVIEPAEQQVVEPAALAGENGETSDTITVPDVDANVSTDVTVVKVDVTPDEVNVTYEDGGPNTDTSTADNVTVNVGKIEVNCDPTNDDFSGIALGVTNTSPDGGVTVTAKDITISAVEEDGYEASVKGVVDSTAPNNIADANATDANATGGKDTITVTGSIKASASTKTNTAEATGVSTAVSNKTSDVTVTDNVTATATTESDSSAATAVGVSEDAKDGGTANTKVGGDVKSTAVSASNGTATGVQTHANGASSENNVVASNITAEASTKATGVDASAENDSTVAVTANGAITAQSAKEGEIIQEATGASATATEGSAATVTATGDITASNGVSTIGARLEASGTDTDGNESTASVNANDISAEGADASLAYGVQVTAEKGATANVTASGDITATNTGSGQVYAVNSQAFGNSKVNIEAKDITATSTESEKTCGVSITATESKATLVAEDIKASAEGNSAVEGVVINANYSNAPMDAKTAEVYVSAQSITAEAGDKAVGKDVTGLDVSSGGVSSIEATITGDVTAKSASAESGNDTSDVYGVKIITNGTDSNTTTNVQGSITAEREGARVWGAGVYSYGNDVLNVDKNVTAEGTDFVTGVEAMAQGIDSTAEISVGGNVVATATKDDGRDYGATGVRVTASDGGTATVAVMGNVEANGNESVGISAQSKDTDTATTNVFVNGTVSGDKVAIQQIASESSSDGSSKTEYDGQANFYVWKAEVNDAGQVAQVIDTTGYRTQGNYSETVNKEATAALEANIWYIAKVKDSFASLLKAKGTGTYDYSGETYQLAHQDEDVTLDLTLGETDTLEGVYYNADDAESLVATDKLKKDETTGKYKMTMLKGGAMLLGLKLCAHEKGTREEVLKKASCTEKGSKKVTTYCKKCEKVLGVETVEIPMKDHTPGAAKREKEVAPQVGVKGSYELNTYCDVCGTLINSEKGEIDALPEEKSDDGDDQTDDGGNQNDGGDKKTDDSDNQTDDGDKKTDDGDNQTDDGDKKTDDSDNQTDDNDNKTSPSPSPSATPTASAAPSASPTAAPSAMPSASPTAAPSATPTATPTATPSATPTATPTATPSATPSATPTSEPTSTPSAAPSASPSTAPDQGGASDTSGNTSGGTSNGTSNGTSDGSSDGTSNGSSDGTSNDTSGKRAKKEGKGAPTYKEVQELRGLRVADHPRMAKALKTLGENIGVLPVRMWYLDEGVVIPADLMAKYEALPLTDRLLILMELLGCGEPEGLSDEGQVVLEEIHAAVNAMTDAQRAARQADMDAHFQPRSVEVDGVEHSSVCIELEIAEGEHLSYERYTFFEDSGEWKLFKLEMGEYN